MLESVRRPALLVIDMQNDFVREGAPLEVAAARATIPVIARLLERFRARGLPVAYLRYVADPVHFLLAAKLGWIEKLKPPVNACVVGARRHYPDLGSERPVAEIVDELTPRTGEMVIDKTYYSAFHGTGLEKRLAGEHVDAVVVVGTVSEMCVEDTARHAVHFGYPTVIVRDAVSSSDPQAETAMFHAFERNYGWVLDADRLLALPALAAR